MLLTPLQKLPKNGEDWGKLILPKAFKGCPKSKISPNLVTLVLDYLLDYAATLAVHDWHNGKL